MNDDNSNSNSDSGINKGESVTMVAMAGLQVSVVDSLRELAWVTCPLADITTTTISNNEEAE